MRRSLIPLLLLSALAVGCASAPKLTPQTSVRGDRVLSDFYVPPAHLPDKAGVLIRKEALSDTQSVEGASENIRLLYSSKDGMTGASVVAVSGALYLPQGETPEDGWPIMLWSHGTVGVADVCAPSWTGWANNHRNYMSQWLEKGYAVLTSDYQGLGTPGRHAYMSLRPMAYSNLDLLRAVQASDLDLSDTVFVGGQSQGASAAIATAIYADDQLQDLGLSGVIVTGVPFFTEESLEAVLMQADPEAWHPNVALSLYALTMAEQVDEDFSLQDIVSDAEWPTVSKVYDQCVFDYFSTTQAANLSPAKIFNGSYVEPMKTAFREMIYPDLDIDIPVFVGTGARDSITPMPMQQGFVETACKAGVPVHSKVYETADHFEALTASFADAEKFAEDVMANKNVSTSNCLH